VHSEIPNTPGKAILVRGSILQSKTSICGLLSTRKAIVAPQKSLAP
jgi:hypothetical protein